MTAAQNSTLDRLTRILVDHLCILPDQVTPEARLAKDLKADSLDHVELIMAVEEEFAIYITDEDGETITTVASYVALIDRLVADRAEVRQ